MIYKFLKFGVVGFSGVIIDYFITFICKEKLKLKPYFSNAIGFSIAASSNYLFNRIWTFNSVYPKIAIEFSSFIIISLIGLIINSFFLYLFYQKYNFSSMVSEKLKLSINLVFPSFYISKFFAIGITTIWNFFANYYITFNL